MPNIQLANNLRFLRKEYNLTQEALSDMLNISRQAYSNYETNKRTPDLDALLRLAQFYHVSLDDLVLNDLAHPHSFSSSTGEGRVPYYFSKEKETGVTIYISETELELITDFRSLSKENQRIASGFIKSAK